MTPAAPAGHQAAAVQPHGDGPARPGGHAREPDPRDRSPTRPESAEPTASGSCRAGRPKTKKDDLVEQRNGNTRAPSTGRSSSAQMQERAAAPRRPPAARSTTTCRPSRRTSPTASRWPTICCSSCTCSSCGDRRGASRRGDLPQPRRARLPGSHLGDIAGRELEVDLEVAEEALELVQASTPWAAARATCRSAWSSRKRHHFPKDPNFEPILRDHLAQPGAPQLPGHRQGIWTSSSRTSSSTTR